MNLAAELVRDSQEYAVAGCTATPYVQGAVASGGERRGTRDAGCDHKTVCLADQRCRTWWLNSPLLIEPVLPRHKPARVKLHSAADPPERSCRVYEGLAVSDWRNSVSELLRDRANLSDGGAGRKTLAKTPHLARARDERP